MIIEAFSRMALNFFKDGVSLGTLLGDTDGVSLGTLLGDTDGVRLGPLP